MTRILGIDILPHSILQIRYAVTLVDTIDNETQILPAIDVDQLLLLMKQNTIDYISVDHVNELTIDPRIAEYLADTEHLQTVQISFEDRSLSRGITQIARELGITIRNKPDPVKTAIIAALLAQSHGIPIHFQRKNGRIIYTLGKKRRINGAQRILSQSVDHNQREYTHREVRGIVENSPYIKSINRVIGFGKEAITFRVTDLMDRDTVVKVFRTYTPIARSIYHGTYKAKQAHIPLLMARSEQQYLELLQGTGVPVPEFYFRDDAMIGMQAICDETNEISPTLAEMRPNTVFTLDQIESFLFQSLDYLYELFERSHIVHGDYSSNNLLLSSDGQLYVIDLSQAKRVNKNTFTSTPLRLRMDAALDILFRDLYGILVFFEKEFRISVEKDVIFSEFHQLIPDYFDDKVDFIKIKWQQKFT